MFTFKLNDDVELKLLERRHAAQLYLLTIQNREHLKEWLPWLDYVQKIEDSDTFIQSTLGQFSKGNGFQAGIWVEGRLAGIIGLHQIDWPNRKTSIGYWLGADFGGRGIMTEATKAVTDYCFKELGLNRIEIRCAKGNDKSCAIPKRLGFEYEGLHKQAEWLYDHYVDHEVYAMTADRWT